MKTSTVISLAG